MSVLIKGMDMPKKCSGCVMRVDDPDIGMRCGITGNDIDMLTFCICRLSDCPLVEIRVPHGRLGDLDALESEGADLCCDNGYYGSTEWGFSYEMIDNAPTVLEAEGKDDG